MAPISQFTRRIGAVVTLLVVCLHSTSAARPWGTTIGSVRSVSEETLRPEVRTALAKADEAHIWRQVEHAYRYSQDGEQDDDDQVIPVSSSGSEEYDAILHNNKNVRMFGRPTVPTQDHDDNDDELTALLNSYSSRIGRRIA